MTTCCERHAHLRWAAVLSSPAVCSLAIPLIPIGLPAQFVILNMFLLPPKSPVLLPQNDFLGNIEI